MKDDAHIKFGEIKFWFDRNKLNVVDQAIDLPDNEYAVRLVLDLKQGEMGVVKQGNEVIGECEIDKPERLESYDTLFYKIALNVSRIDWSDADSKLYFKASVNFIYQIGKSREIGSIDDVSISRSSGGGKKKNVEFVGGGKMLNIDDFSDRIKLLVYSRFY